MVDPVQIRVRRDTAAAFAAVVPADGELIYEKDTKLQKIGDGTTTADGLDAAAFVDGDTHLFGPEVLAALASYLNVAGTNVLMLGDSIIAGVGVAADNGVTTRTAYWLQQYVGQPFTVTNGGVPGDTTGNMLARLPALLAQKRPAVVTLSATINDLRTDRSGSTADTIGNMRRMIALCRLAGATPIIVTSTPFTYTSFSGSYNQASVDARAPQVAAVKALAASLGVLVADVDDAWSQAPSFATNFTVDGIHPNETGADGWARVIASAIAVQPAITGLGAGTGAADNFTRADTTSGLGTTPTGAFPWKYGGGGLWGIASSQAYSPVGGSGEPTAYIDDSLANFELSTKVNAFETGKTGLVFRRSDENNLWLLWVNAGNWSLYKKIAGGYTGVGTGSAAAAGDVLTVTAKGSSITVKINGTQQLAATDGFNSTATQKGFWSPASAVSRFAAFSTKPI